MNVENAPVNIAPTANAGPNQNITLPTNSVTLDGSDSEDLDGSIKSYKWTKVGGTGTINSPNSVSTSVTGLTNVGSYTFILTVTDNENAESSDLVIVTVSDPVVPKATWNGSQNVSIGQPSVSGTVTISGGPMTFIFGIGSSGPESGIITFIINGKSYTASISGGGSNERITESFPHGTYNYSLTLSGSGNYSGGVNAQGSP
ncbi:PKD domain-containing protein [Zobellia laminariae]|uniref:PKD domain-containing protein n=1 Tax=Zobellia laminariae TaxID=248906 RepID=UPI0026F44A5E|nr:PKD domain-containing protein [Zobellia laminariae]WKX76123.1 PKD domain-containing protein [Zobellia laminariae]